MSGTVRGRRMEQETTNEGLGRERGALLRFAAMAAISWFAAGLGASLLHVSARGSAWHDEGLALAARVSLISLELFVLTYPAILVTLPVFALLGRPDVSPERKRWRRPRTVLAVFIVAAPALAYIASWAVFRSTGHFLSQSTLALWWSSPVQMAEQIGRAHV